MSNDLPREDETALILRFAAGEADLICELHARYGRVMARTATRLTVVAPADAPGLRDVTVRNGDAAASLLSGVRLPHPHRLVETGTGNSLAIASTNGCAKDSA